MKENVTVKQDEKINSQSFIVIVIYNNSQQCHVSGVTTIVAKQQIPQPLSGKRLHKHTTVVLCAFLQVQVCSLPSLA